MLESPINPILWDGSKRGPVCKKMNTSDSNLEGNIHTSSELQPLFSRTRSGAPHGQNPILLQRSKSSKGTPRWPSVCWLQTEKGETRVCTHQVRLSAPWGPPRCDPKTPGRHHHAGIGWDSSKVSGKMQEVCESQPPPHGGSDERRRVEGQRLEMRQPATH